jgi:hypothetical protein
LRKFEEFAVDLKLLSVAPPPLPDKFFLLPLFPFGEAMCVEYLFELDVYGFLVGCILKMYAVIKSDHNECNTKSINSKWNNRQFTKSVNLSVKFKEL